MKLSVSKPQRYAKRRAHTATHLLHSELGRIFPDTKQAGSLVDNDLLRFDFYADRLLTEWELAQIQKYVNQMIYLGLEVKTEEMAIDDAAKLGAKMFFEEKYGDRVRVVQVENWDFSDDLDDEAVAYFAGYGKFISIELCGGTHVETTDQIWWFTIISQEAVASGIKRITALTGARVNEKAESLTAILDQLNGELQVKAASQLPEKAKKLVKELTEAQSKVESLETQVITTLLKSGEKKSNADFGVIMLLPSTTNFKMLAGIVKSEIGSQNCCFFTAEGNYLILTDEMTNAKELAQKLGLKGGGNPQQVQGRDPKIVELFD